MLSKTKPENKMSAEVRSPANFVQYPPPPIDPTLSPLVRFLCFDLCDAAVGGHNLLIPMHHGIFALDFFRCKFVLTGTHDA